MRIAASATSSVDQLTRDASRKPGMRDGPSYVTSHVPQASACVSHPMGCEALPLRDTVAVYRASSGERTHDLR